MSPFQEPRKRWMSPFQDHRFRIRKGALSPLQDPPFPTNPPVVIPESPQRGRIPDTAQA